MDKTAVEARRILNEYARRERELPDDTYAPWQPWIALNLTDLRRHAVVMLHDLSLFPSSSSEILEIGYGSLGWLAEAISWGVTSSRVHGIELDENRAKKAMELLPVADLRVGDATSLPWESNIFDLVIVSTVFSSVLDDEVRSIIAAEIERVMRPGGALLWYDFRVNNPKNSNVRKVTKRELLALFPSLSGKVRSVTLAPPIARAVAPVSWVAAIVLSALPFLRTHLIAVLVKQK